MNVLDWKPAVRWTAGYLSTRTRIPREDWEQQIWLRLLGGSTATRRSAGRPADLYDPSKGNRVAFILRWISIPRRRHEELPSQEINVGVSDDHVGAFELHDLIDTLLLDLPDLQRQACRAFLCGKTLKQLGEETGKSRATWSWQFQQALSTLRSLLTLRGLEQCDCLNTWNPETYSPLTSSSISDHWEEP